MTHQLNIFLLLFGAIQGGLVSFFLIRHKKRDHSLIFLTLLLIVAGLQLTFKVITKVWLMENVGLFYNLSYCLPYLAGPLIYFFIRSRLTAYTFSKSHLLHFLPFVIVLISHLRAFIAQTAYVDAFTVWILYDYVALVFELTSLIIYSVLSWNLLKKSSTSIKKNLSQFLGFVSGAEAVIIVAIALMHHFYGTFPDVRLLFLVLTFLIYWISYKLMSQPELFLPLLKDTDVVPMKVATNASKYSHSGLKPEDAERIADLLNNAMHEKKLYLESDLTIDKLASSLNISRHHLSQVLNDRFQKSYFDFLNGFRIEEARKRLADQKNSRFTIAAIALDSGFSSVSSFNESFKKQFGITPSKFRESTRNKMSA
jgi:AraC-like DNA-binding protein